MRLRIDGDARTYQYPSQRTTAHFQATDKAIRRVLAELERKQREERRRNEEDRAADRADFRRSFA